MKTLRGLLYFVFMGAMVVTCYRGLIKASVTYTPTQAVKHTLKTERPLARANKPEIKAPTFEEYQEEIRNEIMYGEMELLAQLIEAEAGNQDFDGKRLVADVVLNRVDAGFGETVEEVIFQSGAFTCVDDGNFEKAAYHISADSFKAAEMEMMNDRLDTTLIYYRTERYSDYGTPAYIHGDHWFSTL